MGKNDDLRIFEQEIFVFRYFRVITEEEFIRGCMADRVLYQMLTADTSDADR